MTSEIQLLNLLQKYTRFNQSSLLDYLFTARQKHQEVRKVLDDKGSKELLREKIIDLNNYFECQFSDASEKTFGYIKEYFTEEYCSKRSKIPLRIAIKVIVDDEIVSLERFPLCEYEDFESKASENSAFESLVFENNKEYYLCNNIPYAIKHKKYKNNRIDIEKAKKYNYKNKITAVDSSDHNNVSDIEWVHCWNKVRLKTSGVEDYPPPLSCYKSTLVVPIFANSGELKSKKIKHFFSLNEDKNMNRGKIIVGYLCLDHPLEDYFREETDVKIADIFSKFLSFYMFTQIAYTQYSTVYFRAIEIIGEL